MTSVVTAPEERQDAPAVDREKKCPLLLRVFVSTGRPHQIQDYTRGNVPSNELQIYTWMDATLKELSGLVKEVNPDARKKGTTFEFRLVYPDPRSPMMRFREIGGTTSGVKGPDDNKSLANARFQIGDFLDISIITPAVRAGVGSGGRDRDRGDRFNHGDRGDRFSGGDRGFNSGHRYRPY